MRKHKLMPYGVHGERAAQEENSVSVFPAFPLNQGWLTCSLVRLRALRTQALLQPQTSRCKSRSRSRRWVLGRSQPLRQLLYLFVTVPKNTWSKSTRIKTTHTHTHPPPFSLVPFLIWEMYFCILAQSHAAGSLYYIGIMFTAVTKIFALLSSPKSPGVSFSHQGAYLIHYLATSHGLSIATFSTRPE